MAEKFSYWDDEPLRKHAWDEGHYYDEEGDEHDYQPDKFQRGQYVDWNGDQYQIYNFDPSDGQYMVEDPETGHTHWADADELRPWEGGGANAQTFEDFPIGSKWMLNGKPVEVTQHDPHDSSLPIYVVKADGTSEWLYQEQLGNLKPHVPPVNPRGFMEGDLVNYMHPDFGAMPGQIEQAVHPFDEGHSILNLDKDKQQPMLPGQQWPPLQYTVPHDQIKQQLKHDRGQVNPDAELPGEFLHPAQKFPIGGTVYHGLSGKPQTITDYVPPSGVGYGSGKYTLDDGQALKENSLSDQFVPDPKQQYWHGQSGYYKGQPIEIHNYDPYYDEYTYSTPGSTGNQILKGKHIAPTPDHVYEDQNFTPGQQVYFAQKPYSVEHYDPYHKQYGLKDYEGPVDQQYLLGSPDELYPGQQFKTNDMVYPWGSNSAHAVTGYNPMNGQYNVEGPEFNGGYSAASLAPGPYTDKHTCKVCKGTGVQVKTCPTCGGTGTFGQSMVDPQMDIFHTPQQSDKCPTCHGSGHVEETCYQCEGTGNTWQTAQPQMEFPPAKAVKCPACGGAGCAECGGKGWHIPPPPGAETCPGCHGSGERKGKPCEYCHGNGWQDPLDCPRCEGTGRVHTNYGDENCRWCHGTGQRWLTPDVSKHVDPATGQTVTVKQVEHDNLGGHHSDQLEANSFPQPDSSHSSYSYRRPTAYDPETRTLYVGPTGAVHGDIFQRGFHTPVQEGEYVEGDPNGYSDQKGWNVGYIHHDKLNPHYGNEMGWYQDPGGIFSAPENHEFLSNIMGYGSGPAAPAIDTTQQVDATGLDDLDLGF